MEVPAGVEIQTWTLEGTYTTEDGSEPVQEKVGVAFDGSDIYVQGLAYYFPEAWIKGTVTDGVATFPAWQFVGEDEYGVEYLLGTSDGTTAEDMLFTVDDDAQKLTMTTKYILENDGKEKISFWGYWSNVVLYAGEPVVEEPVEAPADLETEPYIFKGMAQEYNYGNEEDFEDYQIQVAVGFDGDDAYIQGIAQDMPELWVKATKNANGQYVIPANQYMGEMVYWTYSFPYYFTAVSDNDELVDVVLDYDAETQTFSTNQLLALNGDKSTLYYYLLYQDVVITKLIEVAATPADPSVTGYNPSGSYPNVQFDIPAIGTQSEDLDVSKLFYTIWIAKNGNEEKLTLTADLYDQDFTEDVTEIEYLHSGYDVNKAGSRVYLNQGADEIGSWTKIGVQSIYYGGNEMHCSNIVWNDGSITPNIATGISSINADADGERYYDALGRRTNSQTKGLIIKQVRQADGTLKTQKMVRK